MAKLKNVNWNKKKGGVVLFKERKGLEEKAFVEATLPMP
jgi:hypothetical protein